MVLVSVTSLDPELARKLEPRADTPHRRLQAIEQLSAAGIPVGAMVAPIIPGLTDHQLEAILAAVARPARARRATSCCACPTRSRTCSRTGCDAHAPLRADHVLSLVRACRGGRLNDPAFGRRMRGEGAYAELIARRFAVARRKLGWTGSTGRCAPTCSSRPRRPAPAPADLSRKSEPSRAHRRRP